MRQKNTNGVHFRKKKTWEKPEPKPHNKQSKHKAGKIFFLYQLFRSWSQLNRRSIQQTCQCVKQMKYRSKINHFPTSHSKMKKKKKIPLHFHRKEQTLPLVLSSVNTQRTSNQLVEEITKSYKKKILNTATNFQAILSWKQSLS